MNRDGCRIEPGHELDYEVFEELLRDDWGALVATTTALDQIGVYHRAARRQMDRLDAIFSELESLPPEDDAGEDGRSARGDAFELLSVESGYYFACWHRIERMMHLLAETSGLAGAGAVYARHKPELDRYATVRNDLQHIDARLPGRGGTHKKALDRGAAINPFDGSWSFGTIARHTRSYHLGGVTVELNRDGLQRLEVIVADLDAALRRELRDRARRPRSRRPQPHRAGASAQEGSR